MIGSRLGKWVIDRELGRGGMGRVYLAHEDPGERRAAVKVLAADLAMEPGFLERFRREIEVLSELDHPNIVRFYESGTQETINYYAMEYVEGDDFDHWIRGRPRLSWKDVLDAGLQICPALKHAHDRGIIHRDLKPPNLLRTAQGIVKLTDFGIAKVFAGRQLTNTGGVVGTAEYLSPEQASGKQATKRSDLYSLGVVLYTMLTGRTPFSGHSTAEILHKHLYSQFNRPMKLVPEIPHELDEVVCQLLEKDPAKRPADALVLQRQLESIRRKLERKSQNTSAGLPTDNTVAENRRAPLPETEAASDTVLGRHSRRGDERETKKEFSLSQWLNHPAVLATLLLICVSIIAWRFWPRHTPTADELYQQGAELLASDDPADQQRAWDDYLGPLEREYPDHPLKEEVSLRLAMNRQLANERGSEAERFYRRGLRHCKEGDAQSARQTWQSVIDAFSGVESEARWTALSAEGIRMLDRKAPMNQRHLDEIRKIVERSRAGDPAMQALRKLYENDPEVQKLLK